MPNGCIIVKCPYFVRENQTTIFCESNIGSGFYAQVSPQVWKNQSICGQHCAKFPDMTALMQDYLNDFTEERRMTTCGKTEKSRTESEAAGMRR